MGITSFVLKFEGKKPKIVDFFLMANFLWSFFLGPKMTPETEPPDANSEPPDATFEKSSFKFEPPDATLYSIFLKAASGGSVLGVIFGPGKK